LFTFPGVAPLTERDRAVTTLLSFSPPAVSPR